MNLNIQTPKWALSLLEPKRYKGAKGGRGCVHPDTLIDTPNGVFKIKDFKGGEVYSFHKGRKIIAIATKPKQYAEEQLYKVVFENKKELIVTDEHKFLTPYGYIETKDLTSGSEVFSELCQDSLSLLRSNLELYLQEFLQDAHRWIEKSVDYQDDYLGYRHLYDELLRVFLDSGLFCFQLPSDEQLHNFRVSSRLDDLDFVCKDSLSFFLYHPQIQDAHPLKEGRSYVDKENHTYEKFFEQLLDLIPLPQLSHENSTPLLLNGIFSVFHQVFESALSQGKIPQKVLCKTLSVFYDVLCYCMPYYFIFNDFKIQKIINITKHNRLKYWDIHVPFYNNYIAEGFVNHNSGKSHFFAESLVEAIVLNPNTSAVCIREIQKSLKFSAKRLIEDKIESMGVSNLFNITQSEIRSTKGKGVILFQGMQDHTADSIKSLEGFNIAWVEEAQTLSKKSLQLLRPTIRAEGSEIWFSWNPERNNDPVDEFFQTLTEDMVLVHVNSEQNPFLPETLKNERESDRVRMSPEDYSHVWEGAYNEKSEALVFKDKYDIDYFEVNEQWTRLQGLDWGFSQDPTVGICVYTDEKNLYIRYEAGKVALELDDTAKFINSRIPDFEKYTVRADNARPESISHVKRKGLKKIVGEPKLKIEDGIEFLRNYNSIIIHPDCKETIKEFGLYSYKIDKRSGDILPIIVDKNNHYIDAIRYALYPLIKNSKTKVRLSQLI